ncbi:hypothetical protein EV363DRAFT_1413218 [Boletus edulis]|nr:hypothetical protein EV363DRAFT_1413218 [Boletus edulis]
MRFAKSLVVFILLGVAAAAVVPDIAVRDAAVDVEELHKTPHDTRDTTVEDGKGHHKGHPAVRAVLDTPATPRKRKKILTRDIPPLAQLQRVMLARIHHDTRDTTVEDGKGHHKGHPAVRAVFDTVDHDHRHSARDTAEEKKESHKGHPSTRSAPGGDARIHHGPRDAGEENDKGHHKGHSFARDVAGEDKGHHKHTRNTSVKGKKGDRKGHHARDIAADKKGHHKTHNARDTAEQDKKGHHKGN